MKLLSRLIIALAICLVAIPTLVTPGQVNADIDSIVLHPSKGTIDTEVYITGDSDDSDDYWVYYQLDDDDWVQVLDDGDFDFDEWEPGEYDYDTETFEIPESTGGKHKISICNDDPNDPDDEEIDDCEEQSKEFTVEPQIEVVEVAGDTIHDPEDAEGPMGTEVELKGNGFGAEEDIDIYFDGYSVELVDDIEADDNGTWEGTFIVPEASQATHDITAGGDDTDEDDVTAVPFYVLPGISVSPVEGSLDDAITVTGSGFNEDEINIEILFDNVMVTSGIKADEYGYWEASFQVPEAAEGLHEVSADGQYTKKRDIAAREFTVLSKVALSPTSGHVGTVLTVTGSGFPASTPISVSYDGVTKGTGTTTASGSLSGITFEATHTQSTHVVNHPVIVTHDSTTVSFEFTMESDPPPIPTLDSPLNAIRIGFVGQVTPTFTWAEVTDPSGVSYTFELGTDPAFAQVLISEAGLTETSYSLTEMEALDYGTYYWKVKAIDGAQNVGEWCSPYSFKSGFMPFWAFIASAVGAAVVIGLLVFFFVRRRRMLYYD